MGRGKPRKRRGWGLLPSPMGRGKPLQRRGGGAVGGGAWAFISL